MSKKPKVKNNKAEQVETPVQQTDVELALLLSQNYAQLMNAQVNIQSINRELERRQRKL